MEDAAAARTASAGHTSAARREQGKKGGEGKKAHRRPPVALAGAARTRSRNGRVLTSLVKYGIARKSSKMPAGGVGPS